MGWKRAKILDLEKTWERLQMGNHLNEIFAALADKIESDYRSSTLLGGNGPKGSVREEMLKNILSDYLPRNVKVYGSCNAIDATGGISPQIDIAIADPVIPPLFKSDSHQLIPVECLFGTIEIKSNLTVQELLRSCENFARIAKMSKTAYDPDPLRYSTDPLTGKLQNAWPTVGIIIGYHGATMESLIEAFGRWSLRHSRNERPFKIWVLDRGELSWSVPVNSPGEKHTPGSTQLNFYRPRRDQSMLTPMLLSMIAEFREAWMPPFRLDKYISDESLGMFDHVHVARPFSDAAEVSCEECG